MRDRSIFPLPEAPLSPAVPTPRQWTAQCQLEEFEELHRLYYRLGEEFLAVEEESRHSLLDEVERGAIRSIYRTALERYAQKLDICRQKLYP